MNIKQESFAEYITQIRLNRRLTLRQVAEALKISAAYYSDVEKGRRNPLNLEKMEQFAILTNMSSEEKIRMYDLAGKERSEVAPDLPEYIMGHDYVSAALRTARDLGADQSDWEAFVADLKRRKG